MKIEKINENQIRCTLTRADLADRQLKLSELAYGSEKARSLFHDMMTQAADECGFEAEDMPLMIEAIPASADSIVLIITKVEDPEELDTRFSKFAPTAGLETDRKKDASLPVLEGAGDIKNLLGQLKESLNKRIEEKRQEAEKPETSGKPGLKLFSFGNLDSVIDAAKLLGKMYDGANTLYKDPSEGLFILAMTQSGHTANEVSRICNMLSEYSNLEDSGSANLAYLEEHCEVILSADALQTLARI